VLTVSSRRAAVHAEESVRLVNTVQPPDQSGAVASAVRFQPTDNVPSDRLTWVESRHGHRGLALRETARGANLGQCGPIEMQLDIR